VATTESAATSTAGRPKPSRRKYLRRLANQHSGRILMARSVTANKAVLILDA